MFLIHNKVKKLKEEKAQLEHLISLKQEELKSVSRKIYYYEGAMSRKLKKARLAKKPEKQYGSEIIGAVADAGARTS